MTRDRSADWYTFFRLSAWTTIDDATITRLGVMHSSLDFKKSRCLFVYVDYTTEPVPRPYYVGKGNYNRLRAVSRNVLHDNIVAKHGLARRVMYVSLDERDVFEAEVRLIASLKTYVHGGADHWGANFTLGGEGVRGSRRPLTARQSASRAVRQLTLDNQLVAVHPSMKTAMSIVKGSNPVRCCQGHLKTSKGYRWEYVDPITAVTRSESVKRSMQKSASKRAVVQYMSTGEYVATFVCARHASEVSGVSEGNIRRCCTQTSQSRSFGYSAGGFIWCYADDALTRVPPQKREVFEQLTPYGDIIATYPSIVSASSATGIHATNISGCCRGTRKSAGGFTWRHSRIYI